MPLLHQCLCRPIQTLLFSPQHWDCNSRRPISSFSLQISGFRSLSHQRVSTPQVKVENFEEEETIESAKLGDLMQKTELIGINSHSCTPGLYHHIVCPKCNGGKSMERSLSFHITQNKDLAMWRCFRFECGWAGKAFADDQICKVNAPRQITVESLGLEPLSDELIAYFAGRMISEEVLKRNAVMQLSGDKNVIVFPYRRSGVLVNCKYRNLNKRFWQEKGTEKILYGLDDIKDADDIIIVEGEIDKLSMEEAGIYNCVSVPDGAPQKISEKELPPPEKDMRFQYLWNCKEYLDKASRIILATDGDKPGQALAEELARRLGRERCWQVSWPKKDEFSSFKDANEVLTNLGSYALRDLIHNAEMYCVYSSN